MKKLTLTPFTIFIAFFLSACANSLNQQNAPLAQKTSTKAVKVTIISPALRLNGAGFIRQNQSKTTLEIYLASNPLASIKIINQANKSTKQQNQNSKICINAVCYAPLEFNRKFFMQNGYEDLLKDILNARYIYFGENLIENKCGFYQNISKLSLRYEVCDTNVNYTDAKNNIKIKIKEL